MGERALTPDHAGLSVEGVGKVFPLGGGLRPVLRDITFHVPPGGVVCLLGPNGSGKTTLLKCCATLLTPDTGRVRAGGLDVHLSPTAAKRRIGFASTEDQSFYGRLSARMNLWFYGRMYGMSPAAFERRWKELDDLLDLGPSLDRPFRELSSGQKQKFLLARADLHDPGVLILDEPHQNLDPRFSARLRHVIRTEWAERRGKSVLVSTHHLDDARKISDQWVVLAEGRIRFAGSLSAALGTEPDVEALFRRWTEDVSSV